MLVDTLGNMHDVTLHQLKNLVIYTNLVLAWWVIVYSGTSDIGLDTAY